MKKALHKFLKNKHHYWWTVTVLPGIYALLYLYKNNYTLVNSIEQLIGLTAQFIIFPVIVFLVLEKVIVYTLPRFRANLYYSYLIIISTTLMSLNVYMGWRYKALIVLAIVVVISSLFLARHYKKIVLLLLIMTVIAAAQLASFYLIRVIPQSEWASVKEFETIKFINKPNIYLIQPDGYTGKKALKLSPYTINNDDFYKDLERLDFTFKHDYRSNYPSTLTSNASLFTAQHHLFNKGKLGNELWNSRNVIVGSNAILRTLKNNGYETNFISETTYFLTNYPQIFYDRVNITDNDLSYFPYFKSNIDIVAPLKKQLQQEYETPQFTFIEFLSPAHIAVTADQSMGREQERLNYIKNLKKSNLVIKELTQLIIEKDPTALILIVSDHGGFVGLDYTQQIDEELITDRTIQSSIYHSLFAVRAPKDYHAYVYKTASAISVFPNLFAYLAHKKPVDSLDNSSYIQVSQGDKKGVYQYLDNSGESTNMLME